MRRPKTCGDDPVAPIEDSPSFAVVGGLTKREYFAALVLQGFAANPASVDAKRLDLVRDAVRVADDLIDALNAE
ncbi:MAG: hypothetical protein LCH53_04540 [Bacteroidetes bacterium]|nr:hypothetical protein [Bacteroidota bacterium]